MVDRDDELAGLSVEQLIEMLREKTGAGVNLAFPGKVLARQIGRRVRPRVPRTLKTLGAGDDAARAQNLLIEGDNLQALASLYRERGQVDLILTDPPYNTGKDFRYSDKWNTNPNDPDLGEFVASDDPARHTKWMRFMYPRLQMMKSMLKPSGVIAICIDHRELFHLGQLMDEIFEEENRLAIINWQKSYSPRSDNKHVSTATEYVLVYAKNEQRARTRLEERTAAMNARYRNPDGDLRLWKAGDLSAVGAASHQGMVFAIQSPVTGELHYPPSGRHWGTDRRTIKEWLSEWGVQYHEENLHDEDKRAELCSLPTDKVRKNVRALMVTGDLKESRTRALGILEGQPWPAVFFGMDGEGRPQQKRYLEDVKKGRVPMTYWADENLDEPDVLDAVSWDHEESGHSQTGVRELTAVVGAGHGFETVKPLSLMRKIVQIWCPPDGLVLDAFAGSGTTGHAVLELNAEQEAQRRFILIEQGRQESGDPYARTLTADRLRRVVTGSWADHKREGLGGGFTFVSLTRQVDSSALLQMERDEMTDMVIATFSDAARRRGAVVPIPDAAEYKHLVATTASGEGVFLVWTGKSGANNLTETVYEEIVEEAERAGLPDQYVVYSRLILFETDDVLWCQIPDRILADLGIDVRTEAFGTDES